MIGQRLSGIFDARRLTVDAASISLALPSGIDQIAIVGQVRGTKVAAAQSLYFQVNDDGTAVYDVYSPTGPIDTPGQAWGSIGPINGAGAAANLFTMVHVFIGAAASAQQKMLNVNCNGRTSNGAGTSYNWQYWNTYRGLLPLRKILFIPEGGTLLAAGSFLIVSSTAVPAS